MFGVAAVDSLKEKPAAHLSEKKTVLSAPNRPVTNSVRPPIGQSASGIPATSIDRTTAAPAAAGAASRPQSFQPLVSRSAAASGPFKVHSGAMPGPPPRKAAEPDGWNEFDLSQNSISSLLLCTMDVESNLGHEVSPGASRATAVQAPAGSGVQSFQQGAPVKRQRIN